MTRGAILVLLLAACGGDKPKAKEPESPQVSPKITTRQVVDNDGEPTEGVTIVNGRGRMEQADIEAGLDPHKQELSDCYMSRVGKRKWLGGDVQIHWDISKDGEITAVKLVESDLGAWPIEKCLLDIAKAAKFAPPKGGDADFMVPLSFSAKGGALAWDEDQGLRAVGGQLVKIDNCMKDKKVAKKVKAPPDDVTITVYVGPRGAAQSVGFASKASVLDEEWAACAEKAALGWRLPDPRGQVAKLAVRYRAN